jgi:hypothetical protein
MFEKFAEEYSGFLMQVADSSCAAACFTTLCAYSLSRKQKLKSEDILALQIMMYSKIWWMPGFVANEKKSIKYLTKFCNKEPEIIRRGDFTNFFSKTNFTKTSEKTCFYLLVGSFKKQQNRHVLLAVQEKDGVYCCDFDHRNFSVYQCFDMNDLRKQNASIITKIPISNLDLQKIRAEYNSAVECVGKYLRLYYLEKNNGYYKVLLSMSVIHEVDKNLFNDIVFGKIPCLLNAGSIGYLLHKLTTEEKDKFAKSYCVNILKNTKMIKSSMCKLSWVCKPFHDHAKQLIDGHLQYNDHLESFFEGLFYAKTFCKNFVNYQEKLFEKLCQDDEFIALLHDDPNFLYISYKLFGDLVFKESFDDVKINTFCKEIVEHNIGLNYQVAKKLAAQRLKCKVELLKAKEVYLYHAKSINDRVAKISQIIAENKKDCVLLKRNNFPAWELLRPGLFSFIHQNIWDFYSKKYHKKHILRLLKELQGQFDISNLRFIIYFFRGYLRGIKFSNDSNFINCNTKYLYEKNIYLDRSLFNYVIDAFCTNLTIRNRKFKDINSFYLLFSSMKNPGDFSGRQDLVNFMRDLQLILFKKILSNNNLLQRLIECEDDLQLYLWFMDIKSDQYMQNNLSSSELNKIKRFFCPKEFERDNAPKPSGCSIS